MCVHKGFELVPLVQLLGGGEALLLLLLVEHHFLDYRTRLVVQVAQLAILRLDLLSVDLLVALNHAVPPVLPLLLSQIQLKDLATLVVGLNAPRRVLQLDGFHPVAFEQRGAVFDFDGTLLLGHDHVQHLTRGALR